MNPSSRRLQWIFFLAPSLFMLMTLLFPAFSGVVLSFDDHGPSLANYEALFRDPMFWRALANNLIVPLGSLIVEFAMGLALALAISSRQRRSPLIEVSAILPFALPEIVILTLARYMFMPRGYLNGAIALAGGAPWPWVSPRHSLAILTVVVVDAWHVTPIVMLMLMSGLQTIPKELYEAARLDGAGTLASFRYVTLPMLMPAIVGALVLRGIDALRIFSTVLVLTGAEGVPVLSTYAFSLWSDAQQTHRAMAASMILALLVTLIGLGGLALSRRSSASDGVAT